MRIGIDLDGVIFDTERYVRASAELYDISINGKGIVKPEELKISKRYDWDEADLKRYFEKYLMTSMAEAPLLPYAKEVLQRLKRDGHTLIAITSRGGIFYNEELDITNKRLSEDNLGFDKVLFFKLSKLQACKDEKIDIMIDDFYGVIHELSQNNIVCLYLRDVSLKKISNPYVYEVRNWGEIYRKITMLQKGK